MNWQYKIRLKLFPVLGRFEDEAAAHAALENAFNTAFRSRRFLILTVALVATYAAVVFLVPHLNLAKSVGSTVRTIVLFAVSTSVPILPLFALRRQVLRSLWKQLAAAGIPCCTRCGYDLTGNESGTCPECGTEIDRADTQMDE